MTDPQPVQVTMWQTSDGQTHDSKDKAKKHELHCASMKVLSDLIGDRDLKGLNTDIWRIAAKAAEKGKRIVVL